MDILISSPIVSMSFLLLNILFKIIDILVFSMFPLYLRFPRLCTLSHLRSGRLIVLPLTVVHSPEALCERLDIA